MLAWRIVAVYVKTMNDKRMPDVRTLLGPAEASGADGRQSRAAQRAALVRLSEQYGISLRTVRRQEQAGGE